MMARNRGAASPVCKGECSLNATGLISLSPLLALTLGVLVGPAEALAQEVAAAGAQETVQAGIGWFWAIWDAAPGCGITQHCDIGASYGLLWPNTTAFMVKHTLIR